MIISQPSSVIHVLDCVRPSQFEVVSQLNSRERDSNGSYIDKRTASYVIAPTGDMFTILCLALLLFAVSTTQTSANCECEPVGVVDRKLIPDKQMTASSAEDDYLKAPRARLNDTKAWCPNQHNQKRLTGICGCPEAGCRWLGRRSRRFLCPLIMCRCHTQPCNPPSWCNDRAEEHWLQVDMGRTRHVCGVATQGKDAGVDEWTARYKVGLSRDGRNWFIYRENGREKNFKGNNDANSIVKHFFQSPTIARYVRFYPQAREEMLSCMRVEVFVTNDRLLMKGPLQVYQNAWTGGRLRLRCAAQGNPAPVVTWFKEGKQVTDSRAQKSRVVISHLTCQDAGEYSCLIQSNRCPEIRDKKYFQIRIYKRDLGVLCETKSKQK